MVNFQKEDITVSKYPELKKIVELAGGQSLKDIPELMDFANKTVPSGKKAVLAIKIRVHSVKDA